MRYKRFRTGLSSYVFSKMMEAIYSENPTSMALQNLMGGIKSIHGGAWEEGFKYCRKIPVKEFIW